MFGSYKDFLKWFVLHVPCSIRECIGWSTFSCQKSCIWTKNLNSLWKIDHKTCITLVSSLLVTTCTPPLCTPWFCKGHGVQIISRNLYMNQTFEFLVKNWPQNMYHTSIFLTGNYMYPTLWTPWDVLGIGVETPWCLNLDWSIEIYVMYLNFLCHECQGNLQSCQCSYIHKFNVLQYQILQLRSQNMGVGFELSTFII